MAQPLATRDPAADSAATGAAARRALTAAAAAVGSLVRGHDAAIQLVLAAVVARGHVLLEDVPGVGKTTLARAVARTLGAAFSRIQFTADMLPSDVLGVQLLDPQSGTLSFRRGPIFAEVVLADEINRASPKAQSAMLEAMAEGRVTVDDMSHPLPELFTVLATQNPVEHHGTYPLPESQLDRFMISLSLGYPSREEAQALVMAAEPPAERLGALPITCAPAAILAAQRAAQAVTLSAAVARYLVDLVEATRHHPEVLLGVSPRGALALAALARAWALLAGRAYVLPDDVQALAGPCLAHRLVLTGGQRQHRPQLHAVVRDIVGRIDVPR